MTSQSKVIPEKLNLNGEIEITELSVFMRILRALGRHQGKMSFFGRRNQKGSIFH